MYDNTQATRPTLPLLQCPACLHGATLAYILAIALAESVPLKILVAT